MLGESFVAETPLLADKGRAAAQHRSIHAWFTAAQQLPQQAMTTTTEGRKEEEEKEAEEVGSEQVAKDSMDWTVVTRNKRQKKKLIQIFVKVGGTKVTAMEVSLKDDKVEDMMRQIQKDEDA